MRRLLICNNQIRLLSSVLVGLSVSSVAYAQSVPDPGRLQDAELLRQQERDREQRQQFAPTPEVRTEAPELAPLAVIPDNESPCFKIDRIRLEGTGAEAFSWLLSYADEGQDKATGRCLGEQGIALVMRRLQNALIAKGYVTSRILAPEQDLSSGELRLALALGRIRKVALTPDSSTRIHLPWVVPLRAGEVLNLRDIEQGLENLKRTPTAQADIQIVPTDEAGLSDVMVKWVQAFPVRFNASLDDSGSRSTGRNLGNVTLSLDNPLGLSDLVYVSHNRDADSPGEKGTSSYSFYYGIPIGYWFFNLAYSKNDYYQTVAGYLEDYVYSGDSHRGEVGISRLLYRDATTKVTASYQLWSNDAKSYVDDTEVEVQRRKTGGWEAGLSLRQYLGQASLDAGVNYRRGTGIFEAMRAPEELFDEGTSRAKIVTANVALTVPFQVGEAQLRYNGLWRGQWNRTRLVQQDFFSIGSRHSVRGFDGEYSLSAERGWLVRHDLSLAVPVLNGEVYVGVDYGRVGGPNTEYLLGRELSGSVLGWRGALGPYLSYEVFSAWPLSKPEGMRVKNTVYGFGLYLSF